VSEMFNLANYTKYNLGCGDKFFKNYLNVGYWSQLQHGVAYQNPNGIQDTVMLNYDLSKGIPAADGSLDVTYHSHFLEHLSYKDGWQFLRECYRALKPGGIHRIVVPDLELWMRAYVSNDNFIFDKYLQHALSGDRELYGTKAAVFMGMLHNHEHKCGWDYEMLADVLKKIGFRSIEKLMFQESQLPEIRDVEPYDPLRAIESLCVECVR
jgi:predicted SAM-dependent methyltransferase